MCQDNLGTPVILFQWECNPKENEVDIIEKKLRQLDQGHGLLLPNRIKYFYSGNADGYLNRLRTFIESFRNVQILYLSAHGDDNGIFGDRKLETGYVEYNDLVCELNRLTYPYELILGSCYAMSYESKKSLASRLTEAYWIWGYSTKPSPEDVVDLAINRIKATAKLQQKLENASALYAEAKRNQLADTYGQFAEAIVDEFEKEAAIYRDAIPNLKTFKGGHEFSVVS
jgi:hypothetical protein